VRRLDRVLVVDDQDVICEVLRTLLRREGFAVDTADDGSAALTALRREPFDVVLLDKNLPGISGLDVLEQARQIRRDVEIIVMTGYASLDSALTALRLGAYDYLVKPFSDLMEVAAKVRRAAEKAHLRRENERLEQDLRSRNQLLEQTLGELRQTRQLSLAAARTAALADAAGRLGHELKHPLASLGARLQLARAEAQVTPALSSALDAAQAELSRLSQVLGEFLEFARPRPIERAPCDPAALVREVAAELAPVEKVRGSRLELRVPEGAPGCELDAGRVRQVVRNLVRNALDATPPGGLIRVELDVAADAVELSVSDSGPGIAPEALPRVGTPFFTTKSGGTGLGLALSRRIAEEHGGRLEIANRADGGALVRASFPLLPKG
jgi:signal transduction histidine kinase